MAIPTTAQSTSPVSLFRLTQQQDGSLGDLTRATVAYVLTAANGTTAQGTLGVYADGTPTSTVSLSSGIYQVTETAGGYFTSAVTRGVLYVSCANGGKVTGVGWVLAPDGSHSNIGLTVQQGTGDALPSGNVTVQFPGATFKATAFDSLVVCGLQFSARGQGTVNGTPGYRFAVYGSDASAGDRFGINVWTTTGSESNPSYALALQMTQGGNITVH